MSSKRELTKQYKARRPPMGVYLIRNLRDGRVLVNGSMNVDGALNRDRFELRMKCHRNKALLDDWLRDGPEAFRFEIIDRLKERDDLAFDYKGELAAVLALWREEFHRRGNGSYEPASID